MPFNPDTNRAAHFAKLKKNRGGGAALEEKEPEPVPSGEKKPDAAPKPPALERPAMPGKPLETAPAKKAEVKKPAQYEEALQAVLNMDRVGKIELISAIGCDPNQAQVILNSMEAEGLITKGNNGEVRVVNKANVKAKIESLNLPSAPAGAEKQNIEKSEDYVKNIITEITSLKEQIIHELAYNGKSAEYKSLDAKIKKITDDFAIVKLTKSGEEYATKHYQKFIDQVEDDIKQALRLSLGQSSSVANMDGAAGSLVIEGAGKDLTERKVKIKFSDASLGEYEGELSNKVLENILDYSLISPVTLNKLKRVDAALNPTTSLDLKSRVDQAREKYLKAKKEHEKTGIIKKMLGKASSKVQAEIDKIEATLAASEAEYRQVRAEYVAQGADKFLEEQTSLLEARIKNKKDQRAGKNVVTRKAGEALEKFNKGYEKLGKYNGEWALEQLKINPKFLDKVTIPGFSVKGRNIPELKVGKFVARGLNGRTVISAGLLGIGLGFGATSAVGWGAITLRRGLAGLSSGIGTEKLAQIGFNWLDRYFNRYEAVAEGDYWVAGNKLKNLEAKGLLMGKTLAEIQNDPEYQALYKEYEVGLTETINELNSNFYLSSGEAINEIELKLAYQEYNLDLAIAKRENLKDFSRYLGVFAGAVVASGALASLFKNKTELTESSSKTGEHATETLENASPIRPAPLAEGANPPVASAETPQPEASAGVKNSAAAPEEVSSNPNAPKLPEAEAKAPKVQVPGKISVAEVEAPALGKVELPGKAWYEIKNGEVQLHAGSRGIEGAMLDLKSENPEAYSKMIAWMKEQPYTAGDKTIKVGVDVAGNAIKTDGAIIHRYVLQYAHDNEMNVGTGDDYDLNRMYQAKMNIGSNGEVKMEIDEDHDFMPAKKSPAISTELSGSKIVEAAHSDDGLGGSVVPEELEYSYPQEDVTPAAKAGEATEQAVASIKPFETSALAESDQAISYAAGEDSFETPESAPKNPKLEELNKQLAESQARAEAARQEMQASRQITEKLRADYEEFRAADKRMRDSAEANLEKDHEAEAVQALKETVREQQANMLTKKGFEKFAELAPDRELLMSKLKGDFKNISITKGLSKILGGALQPQLEIMDVSAQNLNKLGKMSLKDFFQNINQEAEFESKYKGLANFLLQNDLPELHNEKFLAKTNLKDYLLTKAVYLRMNMGDKLNIPNE